MFRCSSFLFSEDSNFIVAVFLNFCLNTIFLRVSCLFRTRLLVSSFILRFAVVNQSSIRRYLPTLSSAHTFSPEYSTNRLTTASLFRVFPQSHCSLDVIYRHSPETVSNFSNTTISSTRLKLGRELSKSIPKHIKNKLDFVCPVPETGKCYAQGLANELELPYVESLVKAQDIGRSFDIQNSSARRNFIQNKLGILPDLLDGKNVGFVDEAIFTGSTLTIVSELLATTNISLVYFFIPTPFSAQRCPFNMQPDRNILSEYTRPDMLASYFDVDGVFFQEQSSFESIIYNDYGSMCSHVFFFMIFYHD